METTKSGFHHLNSSSFMLPKALLIRKSLSQQNAEASSTEQTGQEMP